MIRPLVMSIAAFAWAACGQAKAEVESPAQEASEVTSTERVSLRSPGCSDTQPGDSSWLLPTVADAEILARAVRAMESLGAMSAVGMQSEPAQSAGCTPDTATYASTSSPSSDLFGEPGGL